MTCSPNNFPRGKKVALNGTGTEVYTYQYANTNIRHKLCTYKEKIYKQMSIIERWKV